MLDRNVRDKLVVIIESYLNEKITAFAFDDQVSELTCITKDDTVQYARKMLWYFYDDCKDHKVVLSKQQWNYFQRLLMLLRSDASVVTEFRRVWSWRQLVAGALLVGFLAIAVSVGWGEHLFIFAIPFGIASILLSLTRRRTPDQEDMRLLSLTPFASLSELFTVHRTVPWFVKKPYPRSLTNRTIRSSFMDAALHFQFIAGWLIVSPLALLFQVFPDTEVRWNVRLATP